MKSKIIDYVTEEVWRQGHDVTESDGLIRVAWMLDAWVYAMGLKGSLTLKHIVNIGRLVEQEKNKGGIRKVDVWVGLRACPEPGEITPMLLDFLRRPSPTPLDDYRRFELIHPFVDGNGRTGKILLNFMNGSLRAPVFPPADFWGRPIRNP
jgi:hypothetical protein